MNDDFIQPASQPASQCISCGRPLNDEVYSVGAENGTWRLFRGDFRSTAAMIENQSVAAVVSDPPYGSGGFSIADVTRSAKTKYLSSDASYQKTLPDIDGDNLHPAAWRRLMDDACTIARQKLMPGGVLAFFIDWRNKPILQEAIASSGLTLRGVVVWDKGLGTRPMKNGFRQQAEYLIWAVNGKLAERETPVYLPGVLRHSTITNGKRHITQKPLALMEQIIEVCVPGGTVWDPFMGSGTTGIAAVQSGRPFLGCESQPEIFRDAHERFRELGDG
jgi:site-specific DNA-methyltransferase (adenine-specific)